MLNYTYFKRITINTTDAIASGYTAVLTIDHAALVSASKSLSSGNDIRVFYDSTGNFTGSETELDRVLWDLDGTESTWNNSSTQIAFKLQAAIGASSSDSTHYRIYYGYSGAGSPPVNKNNVYVFFDGFDSDTSANYTRTNVESMTVSGGVASIPSASADPFGVVYTNALSDGNNIEFQYKLKSTSGQTSSNYQYAGWFMRDTGIDFNDGSLRFNYITDLFQLRTPSVNQNCNVNPPNHSAHTEIDLSSSFHTFRYTKSGSTNKAYYEGTLHSGATSDSYTPQYFGFGGNLSRETIYADDLRLRLFTTNEPTTSLGAEEGGTSESRSPSLSPSPSASTSPSSSASLSESSSPSLSASPSSSASLSESSSPSPSSSASLSPSLSPSSSASLSESRSESRSPSLSPSPSSSASLSESRSESRSISLSPSSSSSLSPSPSSSASLSPSASISLSPSSSQSLSESRSESRSSSLSPSPSSSASLSESRSISLSPSPSSSASLSPSSSASISESRSVSLSPSLSPSPSSSPSSSESRSESSSASPSASPSLSPSLSPSPSSSISLSPSLSPSPSSSESSSKSTSPSFSPSSSESPSPSPGSVNYSRGNYVSMPLDDDDLENIYTDQEVLDVSTENGVMVGQEATSQYMAHQFRTYIGNSRSCMVEWEGQSTLAPSFTPAYLQIFNQETRQWELLDRDNSSPQDTDFILTGIITHARHYKDGDKFITCRVYQLSTP